MASDDQSEPDQAKGQSLPPVAKLARRGAVLAVGLIEPMAATIAACREILAYVNRHALMTGRESDMAAEVAKLNELLDEAYSKLASAVAEARDEIEASARVPVGDGRDVRAD